MENLMYSQTPGLHSSSHSQDSQSMRTGLLSSSSLKDSHVMRAGLIPSSMKQDSPVIRYALAKDKPVYPVKTKYEPAIRNVINQKKRKEMIDERGLEEEVARNVSKILSASRFSSQATSDVLAEPCRPPEHSLSYPSLPPLSSSSSSNNLSTLPPPSPVHPTPASLVRTFFDCHTCRKSFSSSRNLLRHQQMGCPSTVANLDDSTVPMEEFNHLYQPVTGYNMVSAAVKPPPSDEHTYTQQPQSFHTNTENQKTTINYGRDDSIPASPFNNNRNSNDCFVPDCKPSLAGGLDKKTCPHCHRVLCSNSNLRRHRVTCKAALTSNAEDTSGMMSNVSMLPMLPHWKKEAGPYVTVGEALKAHASQAAKLRREHANGTDAREEEAGAEKIFFEGGGVEEGQQPMMEERRSRSPHMNLPTPSLSSLSSLSTPLSSPTPVVSSNNTISPFQCTICFKTFSCRKNVRRHMQALHKVQLPLTTQGSLPQEVSHSHTTSSQGGVSHAAPFHQTISQEGLAQAVSYAPNHINHGNATSQAFKLECIATPQQQMEMRGLHGEVSGGSSMREGIQLAEADSTFNELAKFEERGERGAYGERNFVDRGEGERLQRQIGERIEGDRVFGDRIEGDREYIAPSPALPYQGNFYPGEIGSTIVSVPVESEQAERAEKGEDPLLAYFDWKREQPMDRVTPDSTSRLDYSCFSVKRTLFPSSSPIQSEPLKREPAASSILAADEAVLRARSMSFMVSRSAASRASPILAALLAKHRDATLDVDPTHLQALLQVHADPASLSANNVCYVLELAQRLKFAEVRALCERYICNTLPRFSILRAIRLADKYRMSEVRAILIDSISFDVFHSVSTNHEYKLMSPELKAELLEKWGSFL